MLWSFAVHFGRLCIFVLPHDLLCSCLSCVLTIELHVYSYYIKHEKNPQVKICLVQQRSQAVIWIYWSLVRVSPVLGLPVVGAVGRRPARCLRLMCWFLFSSKSKNNYCFNFWSFVVCWAIISLFVFWRALRMRNFNSVRDTLLDPQKWKVVST